MSRGGYGRTSLKDDDKAFVERMANPKTIDDLADAIHIIGTPANKRMQELENERIATYLIVQHLIVEFIVTQQKQATQEEINALQQMMIAKQVSESNRDREFENQRQQILLQQQAEREKDNTPTQKKIEELEERLQKYPEEVKKIEEKITKMEDRIRKILPALAKENEKQFAVIKHEQKEQYKEDVKGMVFKVAVPGEKGVFRDVLANSPEGLQIINQAYESPEPSKGMKDFIATLLLEYRVETELKMRAITKEREQGVSTPKYEIPPPPPLPTAKSLVAKDNMVNQINLLGALGKGLTGADLLEVLRVNKASVDQVEKTNNGPDVEKRVKKANEEALTQDKEETPSERPKATSMEGCIATSLSIEEDKREAQKVLTECKVELDNKKAEHEQDMAAYKEETGIDLKAQESQESQHSHEPPKLELK